MKLDQTISRPPWTASCLPKAEAVLDRHSDLFTDLDDAVRALLPRFSGAMDDYFEDRGPPLREMLKTVVDRADEILAARLLILVGIDSAIRARVLAEFEKIALTADS